MNDEQWKTDGRSNYCRRKNYCKKDCTARKRFIEAMTIEMVFEKTGIDKIMNAMRRMEH